MKTLELLNYARDEWQRGNDPRDVPSAIDGSIVASTGSGR